MVKVAGFESVLSKANVGLNLSKANVVYIKKNDYVSKKFI